jgi:glycosyltransferase involved in cell wall biosynthesis
VRLADADAESLKTSERRALEAARGVVVTSPSTATLLTDDYDVPPDIITVARPGTERGETAKGSSDGIVRLLSVGSVVPRKGYDVLIAALAPLAALPWRLTIAGDCTRDQAAAARFDADITSHKLADRIEMMGALPADRLATLYVGADIFVLASRFEGYGMAFAEALAHGLPVVGTTAGAIPDTVPPDAGVLVEPNDVKALTRTLRMLIENPKERQWFASGALAAGAALPTWEDSAKLLAGAIEAVT